MTEATQDSIDTTDRLQAELKDRLLWLCSIFGQPSELLRFLAVAEWRRLRTWVRGVEALAVQLVRALALTIAPATLPASAAGAPSGAKRRVPRLERASPDTDYPDSERWIAVCFRFPDAPKSARRAPALRSDPDATLRAFPQQPDSDPRFRSGRRLALRLEAVIRVAQNARRYAQRYSGRLARRAALPKPEKLPAIAPPPAPSVAGIATLDAPPRPPAIETG